MTTEMTQTRDEQSEQETVIHSANADIYETDKAFVLEVDLPGVGKDDIDMTVEEDVLTIEGRTQMTEPDDRMLFREHEHGEYVRRFKLSDDVDPEAIGAELDRGVLKLTLPKRQPVMRKIQIKTD